MNSLPLLLFSLMLNGCSFGQPTKEQKFRQAVENVVIAFSRQDSTRLAKYIDPGIRVYQLHRVGVFDEFKRLKNISFSDSTYSQVLFRDAKNISLLPVQYSALPSYDCTDGAWGKTGLFVDTTRADHLLSTICRQRNKYVPDNIPAKTIRFFYELENKSRRIVLYDQNGTELVFYLTYIRNRWFLTIVDYVSSDCSA